MVPILPLFPGQDNRFFEKQEIFFVRRPSMRVIGIVADMSSLVIPNDMRYASALAILIIVLLVRPQGIFGKQQRVG